MTAERPLDPQRRFRHARSLLDRLRNELPAMTADQVAAVAADLAESVGFLSDAGHHDEAVEIADGAVPLLSSISALPVAEQTAWILHDKAIALRRSDRLDLALAVHEAITNRYDGSPSTELAEVVATSLVEKGSLLEELSRPADSAAAYDELARRFGRHRELAVRKAVATGLTKKGLQAGDPSTAVRCWDEVLEHLYDAAEPQFRPLIATAMRAKAEALGCLGRQNEQITIYDRLISRFGADADLAMQAEVAEAVHDRDEALSERSRSGGFLSRAWARLAGRRTRTESRPVAAAEAQDWLACYADLGLPLYRVADHRVQALIAAAAVTVLTDGFIELWHEPLPEADLRRLFGAQRYATGDFARRLLRLCEAQQPHAAFDRLQREWGEGLAYMLMTPQSRSWTANAVPRTRVRHDSVAFGEEWGHRLDGPVRHVIEIEPGVPAIFAMQDLIATANRRGSDRHAQPGSQRAAGAERTYWTVSRTEFFGAFLSAYPLAYTLALDLPALGRDLAERQAVASLHGDPAARLAQLAEQLSHDCLPYGRRDLVIWTDPRLPDTDPAAARSIVESAYALLRTGGGFLFASPIGSENGRLGANDLLRMVNEVFEIHPSDEPGQRIHLNLATGATSMIAVKR